MRLGVIEGTLSGGNDDKKSPGDPTKELGGCRADQRRDWGMAEAPKGLESLLN